MPIPTLNLAHIPLQERAIPLPLRLIDNFEAERASRSRRLMAHTLDLVFLFGASMALSQILSILFLQIHLPAVNEFGRQGILVAQSGYEYGQLWILGGSFVFFNFLYFVAISFFTQTTIGLGLMGCKLSKMEEGKISCEALLARWLGLTVQYLTFGIPTLLNFQNLMMQDRISKIIVIRLDK